jgi:ornithine decarboxylase
LEKILSHYPQAKLVLRIKTDDAQSGNPLSAKFGADLEEAQAILDKGFEKNANIMGISFHVGSNCLHLETYEKALVDAAHLFQYSKDYWDRNLYLLDLGGGWSGVDDENFVAIAKRVNALVSHFFDPHVQIIAEPGRYFATETTTLAMRILGKKKQENKIVYYLSNGIYGFFICSLYYQYDKKHILNEGWIFRPLNAYSEFSPVYSSFLWGPTCDSGDKIIEDIFLPEMHTEDFLLVENIGAYGQVLQTSFNGMPLSKPYYIYEDHPK